MTASHDQGSGQGARLQEHKSVVPEQNVHSPEQEGEQESGGVSNGGAEGDTWVQV